MKIPLPFLLSITIAIHCSAQQGVPLIPTIPDLPVTSPVSVRMSQDTISNLISLIKTTPRPDFRGLIVIKDNKLVVEEYFNTYWRETIHDIRSSGKAVTALLLGIAIDKGLVKSPEQSIYDFFPKGKFVEPASDTHRDIRIKHLLTMSSGLAADDSNPNSPGNTARWLTKDNWVNFAIELPMIFKPGEKYVYNDVCPMLIGAIIEEASGKTLADFAAENLFKPLNIREVYWYTAPNGRTGPMGNLYLSALDFAKIGLLVLNKGRWNGKTVISNAWINSIFTTRTDISSIDPFFNNYGHFWFGGAKTINNKTYNYFCASGNGGNLLFVVPSENLVVCLTSSAYGQGYGHPRSIKIFELVLGALHSSSGK
jgi:CubicO group peptidase (beta-lactamase class C family)